MSDPKLTDLWSTSSAYAAEFQSEREIADTLELLDLSDARFFVDSGCGNGAFAIAAAKQYPHCQVHACDALGSAVDECAQNGGDLIGRNLHCHVAPADRIPVETRQADRVLSRFVLHHIGNPAAVFQETRRVLNRGGIFLMQAPCNIRDIRMGEILRELFLVMDPSHPRYYYFPAEITAMLQEAKFMLTRPEVQKFTLPGLSGEVAEVVKRHGAENELNLQQTAEGNWSIDLSWLRVIARG
jgi:ubiquinone/menaquinone biosynthesis C-methylase UbiE